MPDECPIHVYCPTGELNQAVKDLKDSSQTYRGDIKDVLTSMSSKIDRLLTIMAQQKEMQKTIDRHETDIKSLQIQMRSTPSRKELITVAIGVITIILATVGGIVSFLIKILHAVGAH